MTIQEYNDIYKNPIVKSMRITSSGGVTITNTNICMEQMSLEESLCSENSLVFGACESGCFKIRIADLNHNFEGEWLTVNQLVAIDDGGCLLKEDGSYLLTEDGDRISLGSHDNAIPYGRFKVFSDKPTNDRRWRDLTCYDAMYDILNAEVIDWYNGLTFPMTMKNFRDSFFTYLGITQETTTLVNDLFMIQGGFSNEGSLSGKTIITSICELNGVFGHISRQGEFEYISLPSADSLTLDWYMDGTGAYEDYTVQKITGITAKSSEEDVGTTVGTDTNVYIVQDNPLIYGSEGTQGLTTALTNLLNNVKDITYRPFNVNTYGNPMLPLGTNLTISTRNQTINSFLMTRVLSGIQSLKDSISADGEQYVPSQVNSLRTETKRTKGKIHELVNNVDELRSTISDLDERVESEIQQLADTIVLKVDANGNIVKVELSANPSTGSTFAVNADNISFTAGSVLRFTANNIVIDSTNFDLDAQGNVICNNLTATNADISGKITSTDGKIGNWNIGQNSIYSRYTIGQASYSAYMISESAKAEIFTQMQNSSFVQRSSLKQGFFELGNSSGATMDTLNPMVTINCGIGTNKAYGYINLYDSEYYGGDYSKPITTVTNDGMSIAANSTVKTLITKDGFKDTDFSTNRVLISDGNQFIDTSSITSTELGYLSGASSNIQTQLNGKQATITGGATTIVSNNLTASKALVSNANGKVAVSNVTATELGYVSGATSNIQGQIDNATTITTKEDNEPYLKRSGVAIGDREYLDKLIGGTIAWNQYVQNGNFVDTSGWRSNNASLSASNNVLSCTLSGGAWNQDVKTSGWSIAFKVNHKYLITFGLQCTSGINNQALSIYIGGSWAFQWGMSTTRTVIRWLYTPSSDRSFSRFLFAGSASGFGGEKYMIDNFMVFDLTQMFGSTIADYIYSLGDNGSVEYLQSYGFLTKEYYPYATGELVSVKPSAHKMSDANDNVLGQYPIPSVELRGMISLQNNKLVFDGDEYASDGNVIRKYGFRSYQSGDESLTDAITDGTNTVYKLTTQTIEIASAYANAQLCAENCHEEFIDNRDIPMPVGHNTEYIDVPNWVENRFFSELPKLPYQYNTYSTDEQVVGTWIDGSYIYLQVYKLSATLTIPSNTWTAVPVISNTNIKAILKATAINSSGTMFDFIGAARDSGSNVKLLSARPSGIEIDNVLILQYIKT